MTAPFGRPRPSWLPALAAILAGAMLCPAAASGQAAANDAPKKAVLVLSSERADFPAVADLERGLREGLADSKGQTEIFVEYLDYGRFPAQRHEAGYAAYLRERYRDTPVDAVVTLHGAAFEFALAHRPDLFPSAPIVAAAMEQWALAGRAAPGGVASVPIVYDFRRTLELALRLQPDAREAVIIAGTSDFDRRRLEEALPAAQSVAPRLSVRVLSGVPLAQIEATVRELPDTSFVLLASMVRDAEGRPLVGRDYAERLARVSAVPIYGVFRSHMERGTLGGAFVDSAAIGRTAASVVARALRKDLPADPVATPSAPLEVSWQAARKWRIPTERIPPEARIAFREPSLWDTHRGAIVLTATVLLLQAALITGLIVQLRRRRQAEAAVRASEEQLKLAVQALPVAILVIDRHGSIILANAQAESMLGYPPRELAGRPVDALLPARLRVTYGRLRDRFFAAARPATAHRDLSALRRDGSELPVQIGLSPLRTGNESFMLAAIGDLTPRYELQRKQQELEHVGRVSMMGEIAASLAHELSQPLTAILSNAQAGLRQLDQGRLDLAEVRDILNDVVADDKRAGEVISMLRTMLRRGKAELRPVRLAVEVRNVLSLLHSELTLQHVEVETAMDGHCVALADRTQIEQVIMNLVMNGMDAMRDIPTQERRLRISVSRSGDGLARVEVRDAGTGIPSAALGKVFDAFWTTKPAGMGMGLAVCKTILESSQGRIWVEPNPDRGVAFVFTLRLAPGSVAAAEQPMPEHAAIEV